MDPLSGVTTIRPAQFAQLTQAANSAVSSNAIPAQQIEKLAPGVTQGAQLQGPSQAGASFENMLGGFVNEVSQKQTAASTAVNGVLTGQNVPLHQAMISVEEASVSFQLMVEVRNRLLDSYQELMKMQV
jgi:flagellar hook-basal body complex protein FliE